MVTSWVKFVVTAGRACVNQVESLRRQFAYDEWANHEVLRTIESNGDNDERSLQLLAHILSAERLWLERLKQQPQSSPVWPKSDLDQSRAQVQDMGRLWREYLESMTAGDLQQTFSYKNSKGEPWTSTIGDVLTHVILHSAYHRGQIASHMREKGHTPAYTDFIHAVRQGWVK
jgi:uncharacterized damage-inducible protein DinB